MSFPLHWSEFGIRLPTSAPEENPGLDEPVSSDTTLFAAHYWQRVGCIDSDVKPLNHMSGVEG
jgi:hypothetical protein